MRKALLVVLILSSALAWATGGACTGQKPLNGMTTGGFLKGVANASVRVCSDTLTPCTTIPLYSDAALTQSISNPVTTDATGNYQYCAAAGSYNEQISGSAFSTVNNTPVTLSGSGDVLQSGNNIFTGTNTFTFLRGRVDATQMTGTDMCAKVNAAWTYAVGLGLGYGEVDATGFHGRQDVSTNCFANFPANATTPKVFNGLLKLAPDVKIVSSVTQNPPTSVIIDGGSAWVWPVNGSSTFGTLMGAMFMPADTFNWATEKAVLTLGYSGGGSTNPRGVWLQNIGVSCTGPNGTYHSGSIGIYNGVAQENTGGDGVSVYNCTRGIEIENDGSIGGAQNSGPWKRLNIQAANVPTSETAWIGFDYCSDTAAGLCKTNRGIDGATFTGPIGGAASSVAVSINGSSFAARNVTIEETQYGVELGRYHAALGVTLDNISGQGHTDFNMTAVVHVVSGSTTAFNAFSVSSEQQQRSDYVIQDEGTGGLSLCGQSSVAVGSPCNGATQTTPAVMFYSCSNQIGYGVSRSCIWNTPAQQGFGTSGGVITSVANVTLDATSFAQAIELIPTTTAGLTATLPATPPNKNWYATIINGANAFPAFINPNGVNLMGATSTWTIPPQGSCTIYTTGTSYYANCGTSQSSLIVAPLVQNFTTTSGDQNITCRVTASACPAGVYRITIHATVTAVGTAGTFQPYCGYTDQSTTVHNPVNATPLGLSNTSLTTIGNTYAGECLVESKGGGSNIKYGVTFTGATGSPSVRVNASAERISIQ
jgi:hypothetical protein